jgi:tetratricopeptide (TPR) repeat protein
MRALAWTTPPTTSERAQLESLGYVVGEPTRPVDLTVGGIDPKDVVPRLRDLDVIRGLIQARDYAGALARAEAFPGDGAYIAAQRAIAALHAGEPARAEQHARACAAASPGYADCWVALGRALGAQRKFAEAESALRRAEKADPADADAPLALGDLRLAQGDDAGAALAYEAAIGTRESSVEAHWRLAALRLSAGDSERARQLLAVVPSEELRSPEAVFTLAAGELAGGQRAAARARIERGLARDPENPALRALLEKAMQP